MNTSMTCDLCKKENCETVFLITVLGLGDRQICAPCYLKMLPNPDRTVNTD